MSAVSAMVDLVTKVADGEPEVQEAKFSITS